MKTVYVTIISFLSILLPLTSRLQAQDEFSLWDDPRYEFANTAQNENYLTPSEKEIIRLANLARMNGPLFADTYIKKYYTLNSTDPYVVTLIDHLRKQRMLSPFAPSVALYHSAQRHASDMGLNGKTGYVSTNGQHYYDRIHQYYPASMSFAENNYYHANEPISIVLGMLVDRNDSTLGNRQNLLSNGVDLVGVSVQPHKLYCNTTVMDFAKRSEGMPPVATRVTRSNNSSADRCPASSKVTKRGMKKKRFILFPW